MKLVSNPALLAAAISLVLGGCTSFPRTFDLPKTEEKAAEVAAEWPVEAAITTAQASTAVAIVQPNKIPESIQNKKVELQLMGRGFADFAAILGYLDVASMVVDEEVKSEEIFIPAFKGTLGDLLGALADAHNIAFNWKNNVLMIEKSAQYLLTLPQDTELASSLVTNLEKLGAENVQASAISGLVAYSATPRNQKLIKPYIERVAQNAAMITMQVAIVSVAIDRNKKTGIDWSKLQLDFTDIGGLQNEQAGFGSAVGLAGSSFTLAALNKSFTLGAVVDVLSNYGHTTTKQNVSLKTLSGSSVTMRSGQTIPYVKEIKTGTTDNDGNTTAAPGVTYDNLQTGLTLNITPTFDADSGLVTTEMDLKLNTLIGFVDLASGLNVGEITQPSTQEQEFNDIIRFKAGETVVIGGISYDNIADQRNTLAGLEKLPIAHKDKTITRNAMFIVLRPTITVYSNAAAQTKADAKVN